MSLQEQEEGYRIMAQDLLTAYRDNIALKASLEKEREGIMLYTYDDGIYLLSNGAHSQDTERVQTSNISNPTENAVANAGKLVARLNREMLEEIEDSMRKVDADLEPVNIGLELLEGKAAVVMRRMYIEGVQETGMADEDGKTITRYQIGKYREELIHAVMEVLAERDRIRGKRMAV